ncbi:23S rRNA (adenine1618-N6)-methyltransferase [Ulvibacter sp. MAR_2010_11]|uniref:23S rRNA (adenine(1618)-N(6))-methyltransferase RlmF n=1 Tax=Ulvibacter sp. MAR_2010_11 TaxID=1250229 RepID=UPI000C2B7C9C|nr:23S rRNA (adenine(1618)-N(6))-methyltransferase RlmF [Ulvibacter sp. MAR_2010_11]PKA84160.1 23S rRNA (adenine1618-N6)-methyltransferase [Ulvibacter sp. MAR_2010_11]
MHPNNIHAAPYNFTALIKTHPPLQEYVYKGQAGLDTVNFSDNKAVLHLNKALLLHHYNLTDWNIPPYYLCPPIPGRADYIHHINDLLPKGGKPSAIKGLDIGTGANCVYPILATRIHNWQMVGVDINPAAVANAIKNVNATEGLKDSIEIRYQGNHAQIFEEIIKKGEYFHFSMCNPPFHTSEEEAVKGTLRKLRNLGDEAPQQTKKEIVLNFGGQANELWCNGGEALFIKRMIKQSVLVKSQVGWFTTLVSKKEHLPAIYKQLDKLKTTHTTIAMEQGNKQSRIVAWKF